LQVSIKKTGTFAGLFYAKRTMKKHQESGFTIIELVVTTVVIGIMIIALTNLVIAVGAIQRQNDHLAVAGRVVEAKIESLRNSHFNALTNGTVDFSGELPAELPSPRSASLTVSEPNPGLKRLDITISYKEGSRTKNVQGSALIGNIGISQ
jgi:prepilin-type N-terminal cleavage/methylation domain-containing protein